MEAYSAAAQVWWLDCEATAIGYGTEEREYAEDNPRPTLKHFMEQLGRDWRESR